MASAAGKLALIPLVAVTVVLGVSGVHGRRTHDPERVAHALADLPPTDDAVVAKSELDTFFEGGWVGWDVKTAVEISCGTVRGQVVPNPVLCVKVSRYILEHYEARERNTYRNYTLLAWSALAPALLALVLGVLQLAGLRRREPPRPV